MGLIEKIEEIRKKPDHVKLRYVWLFVIICMALIISIWLLSVRADIGESSLKNKNSSREKSEIQKSGSELLQEIEKQKDAMKNIQTDINSNQSNN